jgi:hypothetical protein
VVMGAGPEPALSSLCLIFTCSSRSHCYIGAGPLSSKPAVYRPPFAPSPAALPRRRSLCSYTHPSLAAAGAAAPAFNALDPLKRRVQEQVKLHFCDLCLKGRKVRPQLQRARRVPSGAAGPPWRPRPAAVGGAGGPLAPALRARAATLVRCC